MNKYQLAPESGWQSFSENNHLGEHIYSVFIPLVNDGSWHYMNFTVGTGIFEDEMGNTVYFEFVDDSEDIKTLSVSIKKSGLTTIGFLERTMLDIESKYALIRSA